MRIEIGHHAFHCAFKKLGVGFVLVIVGFDLAVHFCHGADGLHGQGLVVFFVFFGGKALNAQAEDDTAECAECVECDFFKVDVDIMNSFLFVLFHFRP